jgi:hypothetical protein
VRQQVFVTLGEMAQVGFHCVILMSYHLKYFEIVNQTISQMHDFILEFYNTKYYFVLLLVYEMK